MPAALLVLLIAGCELPPPDLNDSVGADPASSADPGDAASATVSFQFEADADPEVAALPFMETELLARVLPGAEDDDLEAAYAEIGVTPVGEIPEIQTVALSVAAEAMQAKAAAVAAHPLFESVHKSYLYDVEQFPNDATFNLQDHFETIGVDAAWEITTGANDLIIAVVDTGVEPDHPDLASKLRDGWNVFGRNTDSRDVLGHGTSVAGSAAAVSDNRVGVAGVSWGSPILPIRVTDSQGRATSRDIATGIVWAVKLGARVINVSFAPLGSDRVVLSAAQYARNSGALVFISTGNSGKSYRARRTSRAIFVGALDRPDELASFSNTGPFVDLVAPGTQIYTTKRGRGYGRVSGTSFASPLVAGVAALLWSVNPDFRPVTVENLLFSTAVDLGVRGRDNRYGVGRVDAGAAVAAALDVVEERDTIAPRVEIIDPVDRATVSGILGVSVGAFDSGGLADVVLSVDGNPFTTDTAEPYRLAINARKLSSGLHRLTATATDSSGNASTSARVRIIVTGGTAGGGASGGGSQGGAGSGGGTAGAAGLDATPPIVTFAFPADGSRVFSSVGIRATVTDDTELRTAEWLADGLRQDAEALGGKSAVVDFLWNASAVTNGTHVITLLVEDAAGNQTTARLTLLKD